MASIRTRKNRDGTTTWRVAFRVTGAQASESFTTLAAAEQFARLVDRIGGDAARKKRDAASRSTITLTDVLADYIAQAPDITEGTAANYRAILTRSGLTKRLGGLPIDSIDRADVEAWLRERSTVPSVRTGAPISPKTLRNEHGLLSTLLAHAVMRGWAPANPAKGVRLPKKIRRPMIVLSMAEFRQLLDAVAPAWRALVLLLGVTGIRWGEATALQWQDIDPVACTITIERAWKMGKRGGRVLGPPKTERARRTLETSVSVIKALGPRGRPTDFVFTNSVGNPVRHSNFTRAVWTPACAVLDPPPRIHDLRHFAASHMLRGGAPAIEVSRMLGHESIQTTFDTYGHLIPAVGRPTVRLAEEVGV